MTPIRIAVCNGNCVVAAKVISMASADSGATLSTNLMSGHRPITSSTPMTRIRPPITGIGMISAAEPAITTRASSQIPAKMPAQRVCAPADVETPVRDSEPPTGRAPKKLPAKLPAPCAMKSTDMLGRLPSGFGTAADIPAACASATSATATTAEQQLGHDREVRDGQRRERTGYGCDIPDGLDVDMGDGDDRGDHHQGEQDGERFQRLDEVEHQPHRDRAQA